MKIKLITDSSFLTKEESDNLKIGFLPLIVNINGKSYEDYGQKELREKLISALRDNASEYSTSMGSIGLFSKMVGDAIQDGYDHVVFAGLSKGLSNQYSAFKQLESEFQNKLTVIDTRSVTWQGYELVKILNKIIVNGGTPEMCKHAADDFFNDSRLMAVITDLNHLKKGGRISPAVAAMGNMLKVKVLIHLSKEGKLESYGKSRTIAVAIKKIMDELIEISGEDFINHKLYIGAPSMDSKLTNEIKDEIQKITNAEINFSFVPNVILCHTGEKITGIGVVKNV